MCNNLTKEQNRKFHLKNLEHVDLHSSLPKLGCRGGSVGAKRKKKIERYI